MKQYVIVDRITGNRARRLVHDGRVLNCGALSIGNRPYMAYWWEDPDHTDHFLTVLEHWNEPVCVLKRSPVGHPDFPFFRLTASPLQLQTAGGH